MIRFCRIVVIGVLVLVASKVIAQTNFPIIGIGNKSVTSGYYHVNYPGSIISPTTPTNSVNVAGTGKVQFQSGRTVKLKNGFQASGLSPTGYFKAKAGGPFEVVIMTDDGIDVPKYEKFELGIKLPQSLNDEVDDFLQNLTATNPPGINPYNPDWDTSNDGISIELELTSPSGKVLRKFGFYYREYEEIDKYGKNGINDWWEDQNTGYPWRVRMAVDEIGKWTGYIRVNASNGMSISDQVYIEFNCIPNNDFVHSTRKGFLQVADNKRYLKYSETGESFLAFGLNIISPHGGLRIDPSSGHVTERRMQKLADVGANYFRMWASYKSYGLEGDHVGVYDKYYEFDPGQNQGDFGLGFNIRDRQIDAMALDNIFESAREKNIFIDLTLESIGFDLNCPDPNIPCDPCPDPLVNCDPYGKKFWVNNPYSYQLGLVRPKLFWTDSEAKMYFMRKLRYFIARWGYSTNLGTLCFSTEIDNEGHDITASDAAMLQGWLKEMSDFIKIDLTHKDHLISVHGVQNLPGLYNDVDLILKSDYDKNYNANRDIRKKNLDMWVNYQKPIMLAEAGLSAGYAMHVSHQTHFHNLIWSSIFSGTFGIGNSFYAPPILGEINPSCSCTNCWYKICNPDPNPPAPINQVEPLVTFLDGVDFNQYNFTPHLYRVNAGGAISVMDANLSMEAYILRSSTNELAIGWTHNRTHWWGNPEVPIKQALVDALKDKPYPDWGTLNYGNDIYIDFPTPLSGKFIDIPGLDPTNSFDPSTWYRIEWYSTSTGQIIYSQDNLLTNVFGGDLHVMTPPSDAILGWDFAFKVHKTGKHFRSKNTEDVVQKDQEEPLFDFNMLPNPNGGKFKIKATTEVRSIRITNIWGEEVYQSKNLSGSNSNIDLSKFASGVYFVKVSDANSSSVVKRVLIH